MSKLSNFLSSSDEQEIVKAITEAELNTSGEIRVHIEGTSNKPYMERAVEVFNSLEMYNTKQRNGVLIYIAVEDNQLVIYGDEGIYKIAESNFWDDTCNLIINSFKEGNHKEGIVKGVLEVGEKLKTFFPYKKDDIDELPNTISKG
ncbi:MAG: TPM domain-containing protein [Tenacibaculum sp.]|nr:TPM domain-containing protein [Tenacibaculum sp.]